MKKIKKKKKKLNKKIKVLTLSDHPATPSGIGTQANYIFRALLDSGKFQIISLGGAIKHDNYQPIKTEEYGDDWVIYPVNGYGNPEQIRSAIWQERPDMLWFMTDPRFYEWLWAMEDEIRCHLPMVYYHVWDNFPVPTYNETYYESTDEIVAISKVTYNIVKQVTGREDNLLYHPHSVDTDIFKPIAQEEVDAFIGEHIPVKAENPDRMLFFYNGRNARRKQTGSMIFWFKNFLDDVGHDKATLIMHTEPKDENGQDLHAIVNHLGLVEGQVMFSTQKIQPKLLNLFYNTVDVTLCLSDAEGFGLPITESKAAGTPVIVNMTGGPQEQVTDGEKWFGIGLEPTSRAIIGSQKIPWIYEDRLSEEAVVGAFKEFYNMSKTERDEMGAAARQDILDRYNFDDFKNGWVEHMESIYHKHNSWPTKNYRRWELKNLSEE